MTSLSCVDEGFSIARLTVKTPIHASEKGFGGSFSPSLGSINNDTPEGNGKHVKGSAARTSAHGGRPPTSELL